MDVLFYTIRQYNGLRGKGEIDASGEWFAEAKKKIESGR